MPDGLCCGTCELAEATAQGKLSFEQSPHLVVGDDDTVVVVHERISGKSVVRRLPLHRGQRFVVGRAGDVVIESVFADRRIFSLEVTATGAVFIEDVGSNCGTLVNGARIDRKRLDQRDAINVANNTWLTFQQHDERGQPTPIERAYAEPPSAEQAASRETPASSESTPAALPPAAPPRRSLWQWLRSRSA